KVDRGEDSVEAGMDGLMGCLLLPFWRSGSGALEVEPFGLDANAGRGAYEPNPFANGSLDLSQKGEVKRLRGMLQKSDKDGLGPGVQAPLRALVMHHAPSFPPRQHHSLDPGIPRLFAARDFSFPSGPQNRMQKVGDPLSRSGRDLFLGTPRRPQRRFRAT